jgi:predicted transcriptional regulator
MAIKPRFADAILARRKRYELRRTRPGFSEGSVVWLYATSPRSAVVGLFVAGQVSAAAPATLWRKLGKYTGITRAEFMEYYSGAPTAYAIEVRRARRATSTAPPVGGAVPQSYRYLLQREHAALAARAGVLI